MNIYLDFSARQYLVCRTCHAIANMFHIFLLKNFIFVYCRSAAGKIVAASLLTVGGGLGGTILYAKWDPKFRTNIEKSIPYSDMLFEMILGPPPPPVVPLPKKPVRAKSIEPDLLVCILDNVLIFKHFIHKVESQKSCKVSLYMYARQSSNHCRYRQCLKLQKTQNSQK